MPLPQGRGRSSTKGKGKATSEDLHHQEIREHQDQLAELLERLSTLDVDHSLGNFMEQEELTQLVVHQLLDHIDCLQADLECKKRARQSAEAQLVSTVCKCPASPSIDFLSGSMSCLSKKLRSDIGDGESMSPLSDVSHYLFAVHLPSWDSSCPVSTEPTHNAEGTTPPAPPLLPKEEASKIKMEKQVEQMLVPTSYSLPGCLPPTPMPAMAPELVIDSPLSSDELGSDDHPQLKDRRRSASTRI